MVRLFVAMVRLKASMLFRSIITSFRWSSFDLFIIMMFYVRTMQSGTACRIFLMLLS